VVRAALEFIVVIVYKVVDMTNKIEKYSIMTMDELKELLTPLQLRFVDEYMTDLNGTAAYKRAGASAKTYETQAAGASTMLKNPKVSAYISLKVVALSERTGITAGRVLAELEKMAFASMGDYAAWDGDTLTIKASTKLTKAQLAAVSEITFVPGKFGDTVKIKLHDKKTCLELIGKHLRMFAGEPGIDDNPVEPVEVVINTVDASEN
jgi:phage terminase small subunit